MSKYRITLDGKVYEMEIELVSDHPGVPSEKKKEIRTEKNTEKAPFIPTVNHTAKPTPSAAIPGTVVSPMPGTVTKIYKNEGDSIKAGEIVLVLEAMKMENEIPAPIGGVIKTMNCKVGGTVAGGETLFEIG